MIVRSLTRTAFSVIVLLQTVSPAVAQRLPIAEPHEVGLSVERLEQIGHAVQRFIDDKRLSGAVTIVARRGKVAHFKACGMMNLEASAPMRKDTIFRIYLK